MTTNMPEDQVFQISLPASEILINVVRTLIGQAEDLKIKIDVHNTYNTALRRVLTLLEEHDRPVMVTPICTERDRQRQKECVQSTKDPNQLLGRLKVGRIIAAHRYPSPRRATSEEGGILASEEGNILVSQEGDIASEQGEISASEEGDILASEQGEILEAEEGEIIEQNCSKAMANGTQSVIPTTERAAFPPVRACIFDVDGTLINSEDIYTDIYNHVLHSYGKPNIPWHIKAKQQSKGREGLQLILDWADLSISPEKWSAKCRAQHDRFKNCKILPGVDRLLHSLCTPTTTSSESADKPPQPIRLAIASSSTTTSFETKTSHFPIFKECIPRELCVLGDDPAMSDSRKKPRPDIFLLALERINNARTTAQNGEEDEATKVKPEECLVFEDSIAGVEAARRAGMRVVWVPHEGLRGLCEGREGAVMAGVMDWDKANEDEEAVEEGMKGGLRLKDGWAEMVMSLEDFDEGRYGIGV